MTTIYFIVLPKILEVKVYRTPVYRVAEVDEEFLRKEVSSVSTRESFEKEKAEDDLLSPFVFVRPRFKGNKPASRTIPCEIAR